MEVSEEGIRIGAAKYGQGVYATQSFETAESIGRVRGYVVYDPDYFSDYCIELSDNCSLEPAAPYRYVNHSCSPNCQFVHYDTEGDDGIVEGEIWLETIRPIEEGEQLTIDYAWPASGAILCGCESKSCRGWIVAEEEVEQLPLVEEAAPDCLEDPSITAA